MKIGIPRALMYYYYYPLWKGFFEALGMEVVVSDVSTKNLALEGIRMTVPEICLPIKLYVAHVINLLSKDVDLIFVPRLVSARKYQWFCPKYLGLPELVYYTLPNAADKIISSDIWCNRQDTCKAQDYYPLAKTLGVSRADIKSALKKGQSLYESVRACCHEGFVFDEALEIVLNGRDKADFIHKPEKITLGLLGYVYNMYDPFISMGLIKQLRDLNVNIVTFDELDEDVLFCNRAKNDKGLYWQFTQNLYDSAHYMLNELGVDGLIHVTAFCCGPDSLLGKHLEFETTEMNKPFMTLRVDEHTGESHLKTRIEAFVDMLRRKKYPAGKGVDIA